MRIYFSIFLAILLAAPPTFATVKIANFNVTDSNEHYLQYVRHMTVPFPSQNGATWNSGNDVTGKSAIEVQTIVNSIRALETDARQKEIYTRMRATPTEVFGFRDVSHAKAIVLQRLKTIEMMEDFNATGRFTYWNGQNPASTNAGNWVKGSTTAFYFRQKAGSAFASIEQLVTSQTYGECVGAVITCVWWGASRGMLETGFNGLYPGTAALNMDAASGSPFRNTKPALASDSTIHVPGDWLYFKNHNYDEVINKRVFYKKGWLIGDTKRHIYYWSGENALYVGKGRYEGLGVPDKTLADMKTELVNAYAEDLATVITEVARLGGNYEGLEVRPPNSAQITVRNLKRLTH